MLERLTVDREGLSRSRDRPRPDTGEAPGGDPPTRPGFAADGKALKGTIDAGGKIVHPLSAFDHQIGVTIAQRQVPAKSNEITGFAP